MLFSGFRVVVYGSLCGSVLVFECLLWAARFGWFGVCGVSPARGSAAAATGLGLRGSLPPPTGPGGWWGGPLVPCGQLWACVASRGAAWVPYGTAVAPRGAVRGGRCGAWARLRPPGPSGSVGRRVAPRVAVWARPGLVGWARGGVTTKWGRRGVTTNGADGV